MEQCRRGARQSRIRRSRPRQDHAVPDERRRHPRARGYPLAVPRHGPTCVDADGRIGAPVAADVASKSRPGLPVRPEPKSHDSRKNGRSATMDWKLELIAIPVSDVDRAKAFYVERGRFQCRPRPCGQRRGPLRPADAARVGVLHCARQGGHRRPAGLGSGNADGRRGHRGSARRACRTWRRGQRDPRPSVGLVRVLRRPRRQPLGSPANPASCAERRR